MKQTFNGSGSCINIHRLRNREKKNSWDKYLMYTKIKREYSNSCLTQ